MDKQALRTQFLGRLPAQTAPEFLAVASANELAIEPEAMLSIHDWRGTWPLDTTAPLVDTSAENLRAWTQAEAVGFGVNYEAACVGGNPATPGTLTADQVLGLLALRKIEATRTGLQGALDLALGDTGQATIATSATRGRLDVVLEINPQDEYSAARHRHLALMARDYKRSGEHADLVLSQLNNGAAKFALACEATKEHVGQVLLPADYQSSLMITIVGGA